MIRTIQQNLSSVKTAATVFCSLIGIFSLQFNSLQSQAARESRLNYSQQEDWEKTQLNLLAQAPAFGFDNFVANWAYYRFLQYFGDKAARSETGYALLPNYLEVITQKDPRFVNAYRYIAPVSSIYAGNPEKTVYSLDQALSQISPQIPDSYLMWIYKAHDQLLFLGDAEAAADSYKQAAEWLSNGDNSDTNRSAQRLRQSARFLEQNPDSRLPRIGSWAMILRNVRDPDVQQVAIEKIENLGGKVNIDNQGKVNIEFPEE